MSISLLVSTLIKCVTLIDTPDKCEDAKCNEETEICTVLENDEVTVARCVPTGEYSCMHICNL